MDLLLTLLSVLLGCALLYVVLSYRIVSIIDNHFKNYYSNQVRNDMREFYHEMESYIAIFDNKIKSFKVLIARQEKITKHWDQLLKKKANRDTLEYSSTTDLMPDSIQFPDDNEHKDFLADLFNRMKQEKNSLDKTKNSQKNNTEKQQVDYGATLQANIGYNPSTEETDVDTQDRIAEEILNSWGTKDETNLSTNQIPRHTSNNNTSQLSSRDALRDILHNSLLTQTTDTDIKPNMKDVAMRALATFGASVRKIFYDNSKDTTLAPSPNKLDTTDINVEKQTVSTAHNQFIDMLQNETKHVPYRSQDTVTTPYPVSKPNKGIYDLTKDKQSPKHKEAQEFKDKKNESVINNPLGTDALLLFIEDLKDYSKRPKSLQALLHYGYDLHTLMDMSGIPYSDLQATQRIYNLK